jgi:TetR/AcrR family tetracycline transcriptional repressor
MLPHGEFYDVDKPTGETRTVTSKPRRTASDRVSTARRYPEEPLSRDRIVAAALALVDKEGLAALSMRRLAAELGVDPMAIYYYLPNKAALEYAIVEAVNVSMGPDMLGFDMSLPLYELVVGAGRLLRTALLRHPNAVPLLVVRSGATPTSWRPGDMMVGCLIERGLTPAEGVAAVDAFSTYVTASVHRQTQMPVGPEHDPHVELRKMREALDPAELPNLARALDEGDLMDFDAEFDFGLKALARGYAAIADQRAAG